MCITAEVVRGKVRAEAALVTRYLNGLRRRVDGTARIGSRWCYFFFELTRNNVFSVGSAVCRRDG